MNKHEQTKISPDQKKKWSDLPLSSKSIFSGFKSLEWSNNVNYSAAINLWCYKLVSLQMFAFRSPVDDRLSVQVFQTTADLSGVELHAIFLEARGSHVIDVELQIAAVHDGQHQTQGVFGLVCVR